MKKIVCCVIATAFLIFAMTAIANAAERTWCFQNEEFETLNDEIFTSNKTINGLTLSKGTETRACHCPIKGIYFEKEIYTGEYGDENEGYVKFSVSGPTDIHILAKTKGEDSERDLTVYTTGDGVRRRIEVSKEDDYVYEYRGNAGDVYLYTHNNRGVRIFSITAKDYSTNLGEFAPLREGEKKIWDIQNISGYQGSVTQDINFNGLTIKASSEYPATIAQSGGSREPYGYDKSWYVNIEGMPKSGGRQISFPVNKDSDVYITARASDGTSTRQLRIRNQYYGTPNTELESDILKIGPNVETYRIRYRGNGEIFSISSVDSKIRIYSISVVPRTHKIAPNKTWDISNNSFVAGEYEEKNVDGLNMKNVIIENNAKTGNKKAIHIKSDAYSAMKQISFKASDSSNIRGMHTKSTITIKAKSAYPQDNLMKLVLITSEGYVLGSTNLTSEIKDYEFEYTGTYDNVYVYSYYPNNKKGAGVYIYSINNGINSKTGPEDIERTVSVKKGNKYRYYFTADNIDADAYTYKIHYNAYALDLKYIGYGDGNDNYSSKGINIIKKENGIIEYTVDNKHNNWSGTTISIIFEAKSTGLTTIKYIAESN